ncbi:MAG TPA: hypothetical protein DCG33_02705, partial [Prevotellaceae bacterium]|nr:hypothetical protein [Prevotellaceae bacterium]
MPASAGLTAVRVHSESIPHLPGDFRKVLLNSLLPSMLCKPLFLESVSGLFPVTLACVSAQIPLTFMEKLCKVFDKTIQFLVGKVTDML